MLGKCRVAAQVVASRVVLSSLELVSQLQDINFYLAFLVRISPHLQVRLTAY
jgi:hypothetical protein